MLTIIMEGGCIQTIVSDKPNEIGQTIEVVEYDDDIDQSKVPDASSEVFIKQSDGNMVLAYHTTYGVEKSEIEITRLD